MGLPASILQSFAENPPLRDIDYVESESVLDSLNENSPFAKILAKSSQIMNTVPQVVESQGHVRQDYSTSPHSQGSNLSYSENGRDIPDTMALFQANLAKKSQNTQQNQPTRLVESNYQQPQQSSGIDYSLIKMMIESAVRDTMKEFQPKEIDYLKIGSTIKFVAKDGSVYEGKLSKIGSVK